MYRAAYEETEQPYQLLQPIRIHEPELARDTDMIFYLHWHHDFEFCLVTGGSVLFHVNGRSYPLEEGSGILIGSNWLHSAQSKSGQQCRVTAIVFRDSFFTGGCDTPLYERYVAPVQQGRLVLPVLFSPAVPWQKQVLTLLGEIDAIPAYRRREQELLIHSRLVEAWHLCFLHREEGEGGADGPDRVSRLRSVVDYIHDHYMEELSLSDLAAMASLGEGQFCRVFKEETGMTPIAYLLRHRILQSCRILGETTVPVTEAANAAGFNNISYYNKVFRAMIGCTPTFYRKQGHAPLRGMKESIS